MSIRSAELRDAVAKRCTALFDYGTVTMRQP